MNNVVTETGSGLNPHIKQLTALLTDPSVATFMVEHRDRLIRFGSQYIDAALTAQKRKLVVVDQAELQDDLAKEMVVVLTLFCARLSDGRSVRNRARRWRPPAREAFHIVLCARTDGGRHVPCEAIAVPASARVHDKAAAKLAGTITIIQIEQKSEN